MSLTPRAYPKLLLQSTDPTKRQAWYADNCDKSRESPVYDELQWAYCVSDILNNYMRVKSEILINYLIATQVFKDVRKLILDVRQNFLILSIHSKQKTVDN